MDKKIIFVKTHKGGDEFKSKTSILSGDYKRVLGLIDDKSTVEDLTKRAAPSLRASFDDMLQKLANDGFIQDKDKDKGNSNSKVGDTKAVSGKPTLKMAMPTAQPKDTGDDLDFTSALPKPDNESLAAKEAKAKAQMAIQEQASRAKFESVEKARAEADAKSKQEAEAKARIEAETFRLKAEQEATKVMTELGAVRASAKEEAEAKARAEAEAAHLKAEQEAFQTKAKAEAEAKARIEADRLKTEQEAARAVAELATAQAKAKQEAEAKARAEAETAHLKAEEEAAQAKAALAAVQAKAKQQAEAQARAEAEAAHLKAKQEAEAKAKAEAEAKARIEADRLKAEQKAARATAELATAQAKAKQETEAKARAEAETARLKVEQEEAMLLAEMAAMQVKTKAEAEAKTHAEAAAKTTHQPSLEPHAQIPEDSALKAMSDAEARQLTESQARIWAEAEQRARMQAQQADAMQQVVQKAEKIMPAKVVPRVAKEPRNPLPWGKISASLVVLSVVLAVLLPYVWPMQDYIAQIEKRMSAQLHQPVRIAHLHPSLLPLPKLELQNVVVGSGQELKAGSVVLHFNVVALFTDTKAINRAEIGDLTLRAEFFDQALSWMQASGGDAIYPVTQMVLQRARISGEGLNLPLVNGVVDFDGQGHLLKTVLNSEDGKFSVRLQPQQTRWQIELAIRENSLPLVPGIMFDELNVKGEAVAGAANFGVIEGSLYKGKLQGNARLTWKNGWQLQGQLNVKAWALQDVIPQSGITGDMDGNASFILRAAQFPLLAKDPHLEGSFSVKKGFISSIDMVETARVSSRQGASVGRTHFDELSGTLLVDSNSLQLRQIRISAGVMSANGFVEVVSGKQLSGRVNVDLKMRADMGSMPLTMSGTVTEPVWRVGR